MSRSRLPKRAAAACLGLAALLLAIPATALAAVSVTRAELKSGQLRVEGRGALPGATITISSDSVATGRADSSGSFRVEASGYASSTCRATVSDGATSTETTLADCTTSAPSPSPTPIPTPSPTPTTSSTLVIVDDALPNGNVGSAHSGSLFSTGARGDKPVEYRVVSGRLPAGLSMTRSFGVASALITGTPTTVQLVRRRRAAAAGPVPERLGGDLRYAGDGRDVPVHGPRDRPVGRADDPRVQHRGQQLTPSVARPLEAGARHGVSARLTDALSGHRRQHRNALAVLAPPEPLH